MLIHLSDCIKSCQAEKLRKENGELRTENRKTKGINP